MRTAGFDECLGTFFFLRLLAQPAFSGQGNKFHDLWVKNYQVKGAKWSCHRVTIEDAVAQGLPIDIEELRAAIDDPDGWAQEFLCEFMDTAAVLLPYEVIAPCENPMAWLGAPSGFWEVGQGANGTNEPIDIGIDFGRKKDLTVCWANADVSGYKLTREVLELSKTPTPRQVEILRPRLQRARRACMDYTGPGVGLGDYLVEEFGEWKPEEHKFGKVELCTFSNQLKVDIFSKLRMEFDRKMVGIPVSRVIREDLHSVYRITTPSGGITYRAPHSEDGHADRCTALAMAIRAGSHPAMVGMIRPFPPSGERSRARGERSVEG